MCDGYTPPAQDCCSCPDISPQTKIGLISQGPHLLIHIHSTIHHITIGYSMSNYFICALAFIIVWDWCVEMILFSSETACEYPDHAGDDYSDDDVPDMGGVRTVRDKAFCWSSLSSPRYLGRKCGWQLFVLPRRPSPPQTLHPKLATVQLRDQPATILDFKDWESLGWVEWGDPRVWGWGELESRSNPLREQIQDGGHHLHSRLHFWPTNCWPNDSPIPP